MASAPVKNRPYFHNGQALSSPPLQARLRTYMNSAYAFLGLYITTLFAFDTMAAAETSSFNTKNKASAGRSTGPKRQGWGFGFGGGGGSGGGGPNGGGGGSGKGNGGGVAGGGAGKKFGSVDDVRGPECGSCG